MFCQSRKFCIVLLSPILKDGNRESEQVAYMAGWKAFVRKCFSCP